MSTLSYEEYKNSDSQNTDYPSLFAIKFNDKSDPVTECVIIIRRLCFWPFLVLKSSF